MSAPDLAYRSLSDLGGLLDRREVSAVEVTRAQLERIAAVDPKLNAYITVLADRALVEAEAADVRRRAGARGPLLGVPLALKDLFATAGIRTTAGARILAQHVPASDATVVARLREAGAVTLGKTNMMEFAYGYPHPDFGETANPWAPERTAGGSSGGSAAAVAAGLAYGALGSDTGGSIRSPAAYCGVVGLKPTYGRVSRHGAIPLSWSLDHVGPLARTVRDCALLFDAIAGYDPRDPASADVPLAPTADAVGRDVAGVRVGVVEVLFDKTLDPEAREVARRAIEVLERLGARLEPVEIADLDLVVPAIFTIIQPEATAYHWEQINARPDDYGASVRENLQLGATVLARDYVNAQRLRRRILDGVNAVLARVDAFVFPTQPIVAPPLDAYQLEETSGDVMDLEIAFTGLANLTGHPALSVPCGFTAAGLPVGLQITGRAFDERTVVALAAAYEAATDWHARHPAL